MINLTVMRLYGTFNYILVFIKDMTMNLVSLVPLFQETAPASSSGSFVSTLIMFGGMILIFYFLMIRPQQKKQKALQQMISQMKKGDRVVTIGGVYGTVHAVKESTVVIKVDDNARIEFSKSAIASVVSKAEQSETEQEAK